VLIVIVCFLLPFISKLFSLSMLTHVARRAIARGPALVKTAASRSMGTKSGDWMEGPMGIETDAVHAGVSPDPRTGAVLSPIFQSTTFVQESVENYLAKGFSYSRQANPTVKDLEVRIAKLENGYGATCVSTGMAATTTVISGTMDAGDHCVITESSYGGTNRLCREAFIPKGMEFDFVDMRDLDAVKNAIKPNTKLIFSETPSNPTLRLVDIEAISEISKANNCVHVCDATFATPMICRPLDHGADLVIQSTTKFYDGHNMTVGGAIIAKTQEWDERMHFVSNMHGNIMSPQNAFLTLQTSKTLPLRIRQQSATAQKVAEWLEAHPKVEKVVYPGLDSFPQKELADKYHRDGLHGAMLWFDVAGGDTAAITLMNTIQRPWSLCENLGATESIITACAVMTHANMLVEDRLKVGVSDGFIRISCGIENADDLIKSLSQSLDQI
jgi:cystathionine gamma-lyase